LNGLAFNIQAARTRRGKLKKSARPSVRRCVGRPDERTAARALQYALQRPVVAIESLSELNGSGCCIATVRVQGELRDSNQPFAAGATLRLGSSNGELTTVEVRCAEDDLARIAASRLAK
jgi:hypothetical protein